MAYDRFLIAPLDTGLQTNVRPWLISDDSFAELTNCYMFRGRVQKRFGGELLNKSTPYNNRLRISIGTTDGAGNFAGAVPAGSVSKIGQTFTVGATIFTVWQAVGAMLTTGVATGTYNTGTLAVAINGAAINTAVYFYPSEPVMGLIVQENSVGVAAINDEVTIAFDTRFAYKFVGGATGAWARYGTGANQWTGDNTNFFWGANYQGGTTNIDLLFVTNNLDPVRWVNGVADVWTNFTPRINNTGTTIQTARLIMPFQDRLLLFSTTEGGFRYPQRCRYSQNGTPLYDYVLPAIVGTTDAGGNLPATIVAYTPLRVGGEFRVGPIGVPLSTFVIPSLGNSVTLTRTLGTGSAILNTNTGSLTITTSNAAQPVNFYPGAQAWNQDIPGSGGFIDVPTREEIVSAQYLQNRLIVFCERSTWELAYTGSPTIPFVWRKINTELGVESPFSVIPFDRLVLGIGDVGVHSCTGNNVERIDTKIPDDVFQVRNADSSVLRVHGIRDYYTEFAYWTFPSVNSTSVYQNRVLLYNYRNGSWAYNDDSITCFGYFHNQGVWPTWAEMGDVTWGGADFAWNAGTLQKSFRNIIAGNQTGFVWIVSSGENSATSNSPVLPITNITNPAVGNIYVTIVDHNLATGDYIQIENALGCTFLNGGIYQVGSLTADVVGLVLTDISIIPAPFTVYTGGGTARRVSIIKILTKQYNFYADKSRNASIPKIDFMVDATDNGQMTVECLSSSNNFIVVDTKPLDTAPYASVNMETWATRLWHPIYTSIEGECIQLRITQNDTQLRTPSNSLGEFTLHAMLFYAMPTTHYLQ